MSGTSQRGCMLATAPSLRVYDRRPPCCIKIIFADLLIRLNCSDIGAIWVTVPRGAECAPCFPPVPEGVMSNNDHSRLTAPQKATALT